MRASSRESRVADPSAIGHRRSAARPAAALTLIVAAVALAPAPAPGQEGDARMELGRATYDRWCAHCHGAEGDGEGVAAGYMLPRPRDFTKGTYQIRTTASGMLPTDADMLRMIDEGMPGTAMPGWEEWLSRGEREALVVHLKSFSRFFESEGAPEPLEFGGAPGVTEEGLAEGRRFYEEIECWKCHGQEGRGDGTSSPTLENDDDEPIRATDLTQPWYFNGGGTVEEIYRRLRTGLDGTPMPSFSDLLESGYMTEEQLWRLAQYVRSLAPEREPAVRDVVRAGLVDEDAALPESGADSSWAEVERFWIPLVGQIVVEPRWFEPRVRGVWVQALHDGEELALRVSWTDPSRSPDPAWLEWQEKVIPFMEPHEGEPVQPGPRPDMLTVQFPTEIPEGMQRPYFLGGDARNPVYLWHWTSTGDGATEQVARGFGTGETLDGGALLRSEAAWSDGQWSVLFRRPLVTESEDDASPRLQLAAGQPIPIAFQAWDGDNGEEGGRAAISAWYFVYLTEPTPGTVYATPLLAMVLTAGLGLFVVARAQRREREGHTLDETQATHTT